jgi:hypothetical protein
VESGVYRLVAECRASKEGAFIYVFEESKGDSSMMVKQIPVCAYKEGNIWKAATDSTYNEDKIVKALVDKLEDKAYINSFKFTDEEGIRHKVDVNNMKEAVKYANRGRGFGWSYVYIDNIVVENNGTLCFGVTTDSKLTNGEKFNGWFSAHGFTLERIGDVSNK